MTEPNPNLEASKVTTPEVPGGLSVELQDSGVETAPMQELRTVVDTEEAAIADQAEVKNVAGAIQNTETLAPNFEAPVLGAHSNDIKGPLIDTVKKNQDGTFITILESVFDRIGKVA